jgi:hypothetical protein
MGQRSTRTSTAVEERLRGMIEVAPSGNGDLASLCSRKRCARRFFMSELKLRPPEELASNLFYECSARCCCGWCGRVPLNRPGRKTRVLDPAALNAAAVECGGGSHGNGDGEAKSESEGGDGKERSDRSLGFSTLRL